MNKLFFDRFALLATAFLAFLAKAGAAAPPDSSQASCQYRIDWNLTNLDLLAQLVPGQSGLPPASVKEWTVDDVAAGTLPFLNHTFVNLGDHIVCASYSMPDGSSCKTCQAIRAFPKGDSCHDYKLINAVAGCSTVFEPVCACDGITYGNFCPAVNYHGNNRWTLGKCGELGVCAGLKVDFSTKITGTVVEFTDKTVFTSGTPAGWLWIFDGQQTAAGPNPTFDFGKAGDHRVCVTVTATINGQAGVCVAGHCQILAVGVPPCTDPSLIEPGAVCPSVYDPVCGCDGVTYGNECIATKFGGVTNFTKGECGKLCVESSWKKPINCPPGTPVCGCDGKTYASGCSALYENGVAAWNVGPCDFLASKEPEKGEAVRLFPNPATDRLTAVFADFSPKKIEVFDATGRLFFEKKATGGELEIPLDGLAAGLFWVKVSDGRRVFFKKMVRVE